MTSVKTVVAQKSIQVKVEVAQNKTTQVEVEKLTTQGKKVV